MFRKIYIALCWVADAVNGTLDDREEKENS